MTTDALKLHAALRQVTDGYVTAALRKAGANVILLTPHVSPRVSLELVSGRLEPRVIDDRGAIRHGSDDAPISLDALMAEMRANRDFAPAFTTAPVNTQAKHKRRHPF